MALYRVTTGNTTLAGDINQLVNVLQKPSSATEAGAYYLSSDSYASSSFTSQWISSLNRVSTPASVSINTSLGSPSNINSPSTNWLRSAGFQINSTSTAVTNNANCAGTTTIQY